MNTVFPNFRGLAPLLRILRLVSGLGLASLVSLEAQTAVAPPPPDFFKTVKAFADAMLDESRAHLGGSKLPLFPAVLNRDTYTIPEGAVVNLRTARVPQEFKYTANLHHDQNLYQVLYALTQITGEARFAAEADKVLGYFLKNCQEPRFGFFCWGEHLGWDLRKNEPGGFPENDRAGAFIHEFYRPWVLWGKSFELAPEACHRFAETLWKYQVNHKGSLSFSRHAILGKGADPSRRGYEFPRHGGFYIATWAEAYRRTSDPLMLEAIEAMVSFYESRRDPTSGAISHCTADLEFDRNDKAEEILYIPSNLSLSVDLQDASVSLPPALQKRMRELAAQIDTTLLAMPHDPGPGGKGFVMFARPTTLEPMDYWMKAKDRANGLPPRRHAYSGGWRSAYIGQYPHVRIMPALICRLNQTANPGYKRLLLACADNYLTAEPDFHQEEGMGREGDVEAGTVGAVMQTLNAAFKETQDEKYLRRSEWFGAWALKNFWPDALPLPRGSAHENVYSAMSRSDTLVMAMLETWLLRQPPERSRGIVLLPTDRS